MTYQKQSSLLKPNMKITPRQSQIVAYVKAYQLIHKTSPSMGEIRAHLKLQSDNGVFKMLKIMEREGIITRTKSSKGRSLARSIIIN